MALLFQLGLVANSCIAQQSNLASYTLTRDQIVAIRDLSRDHGTLTFVWDWRPNDPWNWHDESQPEPSPTEGILYGFDGDSFYTTEHTLKALAAFPETSHVNLAYCFRCSDKGIEHLKELKSLRTLVLYRNAARYSGTFPFPVQKPEEIKQLITDQAIEHIAAFPSLEALHLGDNQFSEAAILRLGSLKTLKLLSLDDSQISANGLTELKASLPDCTIEIWGGRKAANANSTRR
ncbi:MAG: hypothetical protein KDA91_01085 [Planctomycetaceae bacterium]|nr:hypothetical protein [Planctomycetaceae bacterium]